MAMQMAGKGAVKNSSKMAALVSSVPETRQKLAKCESIWAPFYSLYSSS